MVVADRIVEPPSQADLEDAWVTVSAWLTPTPLLSSPLRPGALLKLETLQPTGSFKVRGALAALTALPPGVRAVTASAGNHGLGVAHAAALTDRRATVVVSRNASTSKVAALRGYGIDLVEYGDDYDAAEAHALELSRHEDTRFVSAYNDRMVIAGGATLGRELDPFCPDPLTVVVPVGGGGLAAGLALWGRRRGQVDVVGVEAAASRAVSTAVRAGRRVTVEVGATLADGLAGNLEPGAITPGLLAGVTLVAVSEGEIAAAVRWLYAEHGLVVEGSGAVGVAAVLAGRVTVGGTVVVPLTGRNIASQRFADVLTAG